MREGTPPSPLLLRYGLRPTQDRPLPEGEGVPWQAQDGPFPSRGRSVKAEGVSPSPQPSPIIGEGVLVGACLPAPRGALAAS